jgi:hypothetical protein
MNIRRHFIRGLTAALIATGLLHACASVPPLAADLPTPAADQAQLVVYRHGGPLRTGVIRPELHIGTDTHGPVYPTAYRIFTLSPGDYPVWAGTDNSRGTRVSLAPGQTRYVRVVVELDYEARGAQVIEVDVDTAQAAMANLLKLNE